MALGESWRIEVKAAGCEQAPGPINLRLERGRIFPYVMEGDYEEEKSQGRRFVGQETQEPTT
ncbi:MAG: hypothetical protein ABS36_14315 [Acidobacteria bacterium SCN 69-37]|nr:MAG: hypothetical protein ABS36_14315 [Acidobacteria bacterium SCN 69-37]